MIGLPFGGTVYAFDEPRDMRKSCDTLKALVTARMGSAPRGSAQSPRAATRWPPQFGQT